MGHAETGRARTVIIWSVGENEVPPTSDVQRDSETKKRVHGYAFVGRCLNLEVFGRSPR